MNNYLRLQHNSRLYFTAVPMSRACTLTNFHIWRNNENNKSSNGGAYY